MKTLHTMNYPLSKVMNVTGLTGLAGLGRSKRRDRENEFDEAAYRRMKKKEREREEEEKRRKEDEKRRKEEDEKRKRDEDEERRKAHKKEEMDLKEFSRFIANEIELIKDKDGGKDKAMKSSNLSTSADPLSKNRSTISSDGTHVLSKNSAPSHSLPSMIKDDILSAKVASSPSFHSIPTVQYNSSKSIAAVKQSGHIRRASEGGDELRLALKAKKIKDGKEESKSTRFVMRGSDRNKERDGKDKERFPDDDVEIVNDGERHLLSSSRESRSRSKSLKNRGSGAPVLCPVGSVLELHY